MPILGPMNRRKKSRSRRAPREVGVLEARANLSWLLARVAHGETILITRRGRPVARLAPMAARATLGTDTAAAVQTMRSLAGSLRLPEGTNLRDLIEAGRR